MIIFRPLGFNRTDVPFTHAYRITNMGPSPTREPFSYSVFLPRGDLVTAKLADAAADSDFSCSILSTGRFRTDLPAPSGGAALVSCATSPCVVYECVLPAGFAPGESVTAVAEMYFRAAAASDADDGANRYSVRSLARASDSSDRRDLAHFSSELYSLETSFAEMAARHKFYIVGGVLGVLLGAAAVALLWKSKVFSKLRFYNKQLEEAQGKEG